MIEPVQISSIVINAFAPGPSRRSLRCTPMTAIEGEPDFNKASRSGTHQRIVIDLRSFNERLAKKRSY
jgi:hypothetical protein